MKLADLKTRVFRMTNNIYNDTFHMTDLLNDAVNEVASEAKLESIAQISIVAGTSNYPLPSNYKSTRALLEGTIDNPLHTYSLVPPDEHSVGFSIWGGEIIIKPTPSANKTLNFYHYRFPTDMVNEEDEPDIDAKYHDILPAYAAAMILSLPNMENVNKYLIDRYFMMWDEGKARFKADMSKKNRQTSVRKVENWR